MTLRLPLPPPVLRPELCIYAFVDAILSTFVRVLIRTRACMQTGCTG